MRQIVKDDSELRELLQQGDICIVDRGFRDVKVELEVQGYTVYMPALKRYLYNLFKCIIILLLQNCIKQSIKYTKPRFVVSLGNA